MRKSTMCVALTEKEERLAKKLREDGYTITAVATLLETTKDKVMNATIPGRKEYLGGYAKGWQAARKKFK